MENKKTRGIHNENLSESLFEAMCPILATS